ncbi:P-loop containing nucleoside triphosphate hydrolase protein [Trichoderma barbatum]
MESLSIWNPHPAAAEWTQTRLFNFVQGSCEPFSTGLLQAPITSEQSSELPPLVSAGGMQNANDTAAPQPCTDQEIIVCFGMISGVSGRCERPSAENIPPVFEVEIDSSASFSAIDDPRRRGLILSDHGQMIQGLLDESAINLYASCTTHGDLSARKSSQRFAQLSCVLDITVYGPWDLFEQIGIWLQEYGIYLQDPRACHIDVKYCNPHRLSSDNLDSAPMLSQAVSHGNISSYLQYITEGPDLSQHLATETNDWASVAQQTFNVQRGMGPVLCAQCSSTLELAEALFDDSTPAHTSPEFSRCLKFVCGDCTHKLGCANLTAVCHHKPSCPIAPVSISTSVFEDVSSHIPPQITTASTGLPSKVKALVADIKSLPPDVKCVVFSTWRLTLDIVKAGLDQASLDSIRFDGKVPQKDRQSVIEKFKTDPSVRVMLLTLSCGAVGLTLTVASRAYLMEPHWNPTLEEQALARIHRIGQTQEVTTVRFYMRDSFEEQVMELQESKKNLAGVLLSPHDGGRMDDSLGTLQWSKN